MNDQEYLEKIKEGATELMIGSTQTAEDRFAAMMVALIATVTSSNNSNNNN